jgi:hypothetical protein
MLPAQLTKKILGLIALQAILSLGIASALTISPAREELTGDKGESIAKTFLVINEQDTDQVLYTSVEAFDSQGESGTPNFTAGTEGLPSWITITEQVTVKKGERVTIPYTITVPQDADAGGHFAAIFLSTVPPSADGGQVSVGAKVGMLILLKVTGEIKEDGGLSSFTIKEDKKVLSSIPVDFVYRFNNAGNDRVKPEGDIVIRNTLGMETARIDANENEGNVLPGSVRRFDVRYGEGEAPALSAPFFDHVKYQMNNLAVGMYTAEIGLSFGNEGKANASVTYFMFPWQFLSVVLGFLVVFILLLVILVKKYNKWIIQQARAAAKQ